MKIASVATVYNEARFLPKHLQHMPSWVEEQLVLVSAKPWYGEEQPDDGSADIAKGLGATVLVYPWANEVDQRNAGQEFLSDYDWILNLEPDEFLSDDGWKKLHTFLTKAKDHPAYAIRQRIFWGHGFESDPPEDFVPIIATRPDVRFIDKRVIDSGWATMPDDIKLLHFAWARTDAEIWKKISHYSHAVDFDIDKWFKEVWLARRTTNVHPTTPEAIPRLIKAVLPPEIAELDLWPPDD
jgi:glycosyltransferase involved in cell wall biosynthesis